MLAWPRKLAARGRVAWKATPRLRGSDRRAPNLRTLMACGDHLLGRVPSFVTRLMSPQIKQAAFASIAPSLHEIIGINVNQERCPLTFSASVVFGHHIKDMPSMQSR